MKYKYFVEEQLPRIGMRAIGEDVFNEIENKDDITAEELVRKIISLKQNQRIVIRRQDCTYC